MRPPGNMPTPLVFALKIYQRGDCYEWRGHRTEPGYGRFASEGAHRYAYRLAKGTIPRGLDIHHLCQHRWCVRPSHLIAVRPIDHQPWRMGTRSGQCRRGHLFTPGNTIITSSGGRKCRECKRSWTRGRTKTLRARITELEAQIRQLGSLPHTGE